MLNEIMSDKLKNIAANFTRLAGDGALLTQISTCAEWLIGSLRNNGKLMLCGNGGSAADAQHVAGEFLCRFYKDRRPLPAVALTTDTSTITAIGNDYAFDQVFARQVDALGRPGDVLIGISTSGTSKNVLAAFEVAKKKDIRTIMLTGEKSRNTSVSGDLVVVLPSSDTPRVQEMMLAVEHLICEMVEKALTEN